VLAADAATAETLRRRLGATPLAAAEALAALPALLAAPHASPGLARLDWQGARAALAILAEPAFEAVQGTLAADPGAGDLRARLRDLPEAEALSLLRETLAGELARILRLPAGSVAGDAPLIGLGLDSLGGLELRGALEQRLGMPVPLAAVTETLTVDALARRIAEAVRADRQEDGVAALMAAHEPAARPHGGMVEAAE
jgi:acyl carrier protein